MLSIEDRDFCRVVAFVRENFGINLEKKRALIQGRLALEIEKKGFSSFGEYFDKALSDPQSAECAHLIDRLSTNHTFFFREPGCIEHMKNVAVPALMERGVRRVEVWCAACSTGQECYSAAMALEEAISGYEGATYSILGSDISTAALKTAEAGIYPVSELDGIPVKYRKLYCRSRDNKTFYISREIKNNITWRRINLVKPQANARVYHIIFCRNVMIYFNAATKDALTNRLFGSLHDGGFVYVGCTETLDIKREMFDYKGPSIFEKKRRNA